MNTEFVVFDGDKEIDWIDPVVSFHETDEHWVVDNGFGVFEVHKAPGLTYRIRVREGI